MAESECPASVGTEFLYRAVNIHYFSHAAVVEHVPGNDLPDECPDFHAPVHDIYIRQRHGESARNLPGMEYVFGCERRPQPFGAADAPAPGRRIDCGDGSQRLRADDGRPELTVAPEDSIAGIYFARSALEEDYHVLKDTLLFPVMPIYHRLDDRIRTHVFMCVMGLLFCRYIQWKVEKATGVRVPAGRLAAQLSGIRLGGPITGGDEDRKVRFRLEQMGRDEMALVKALNLERFMPNKA